MLGNNLNIINHFSEVEGFRIADRSDDRIIYEKYYENLKNYSPRKNERTNETERCIIIVEAHELKNDLCKIAISVKRSFPSGIDFGHDNILDYNSKKELIPFDFINFDTFYLNISNGYLFKKKHKIEIDNFLHCLYEYHIRRTKPILGIPIRAKTKLHSYMFQTILISIKALELLMRFASGKYVAKENVAQKGYLETLNKKQITIIESSKSLKLPTGWECTQNVAFVSSLLIVLLFYLLWNTIKTSPVVAVILLPSWIIILFFLDRILPYILILLMNSLIKIIEIK
jgi:hypothetical protein